jgi:hypothetical protein
VAAVNWVERRRLFVYPALMSLGVGVLASCAENPRPAPPRTVAVEPPPPPPAPLPARRVFPLPAHKPAPPAENPAGPAETGTDTTALANPEPAPPPPPPASELIGLDQPGATRLLGAATEQSEAPPATIWRYRNGTCELDLFFYLDLRSGKMRTLHYAFKGDTADPASRQDCLRSLIVARGG